MSVARISPLRSTMSGRAVAIASCEAARRALWLSAPIGEHHQPPADHGVDRGEGEDGKSDAGARFGGAVDIAPVEQAADQPLPPRFRRLCGRATGHRRPPGAGTEPVTLAASVAASIVLIIEPIGSGCAGPCKIRRPFGQVLQLIVLSGDDRPQAQMALGHPLQPQRRIEPGPFGAQHRDGVALLADFRIEPLHPLDAGGRFHLDAIDIGRREHQHADDEEMDDPHDQPPLITSASTGHAGSLPSPCAGAVGALRRAQFCRTRARIGRDFGFTRRHRALGQNPEARKPPARLRADAAIRCSPCRARPGNS